MLFGMIHTASSAQYTELALKSFFANTPSVSTFILIDNDGSLDTNIPKKYPIEVIVNSSPKGFSENGNILIGEAVSQRKPLMFMNNDLVFPKNWLDPMLLDHDTVLVPLSNREVMYAVTVSVVKTSHIASMFLTEMPLSLDKYQESAFEAIAEAHRNSTQGYSPVYVAPFFCVRIPLAIMESVGEFDVTFGKAGGEDYDYCLRAYLSGFETHLALGTYLLHFGGKSSWSGAETKTAQLEREEIFLNRFKEKWGTALFNLILKEDPSIMSIFPQKDGKSKEELRGEIEHLIKLGGGLYKTL